MEKKEGVWGGGEGGGGGGGGKEPEKRFLLLTSQFKLQYCQISNRKITKFNYQKYFENL